MGYSLKSFPVKTAKQIYESDVFYIWINFGEDSYCLVSDYLDNRSVLYWDTRHGDLIDKIVDIYGDTPLHNSTKSALNWLLKAIKKSMKETRKSLDLLESEIRQ